MVLSSKPHGPAMPEQITVLDRQFPSFSRPEIHVKIAELLEPMPRGKVLDLPTGSGALAYRLHKAGFDVVGCDIMPENFVPTDVLQVVPGDLRQRFPFDAQTFDLACFIEGPEHAENPYHAFREFARVLKVGGRLILSIPNYANIEQRLKFVMHGCSERAVSGERFERDFGGNPAMLHVSPLTYTELRFFLEANGFEIRRIEKDKFKPKQLLLWPLAALIQLAGRLAGQRGREKYFSDQANSNAVLLGGNTLILIAERVR